MPSPSPVKKSSHRLSERVFRSIYSTVPRLCVDLIVMTKDGVVLSKRDIPPAKGMWHFPGGTVYFRERLTDAVKLVVREELGVRLRVEKKLSALEFSPQSGFGHAVSIVYLVTIVSGTLRGSWQAREVGAYWKPPRHMIPEHRRFFAEFFKNKKSVWG